jgi:hypothetical protein
MAAVQTLKGSFPLAFHRRLAPYVVKHRLRHSDYTIRECAVIVIYVPEIKDCEGDEQGYEKSLGRLFRGLGGLDRCLGLSGCGVRQLVVQRGLRFQGLSRLLGCPKIQVQAVDRNYRDDRVEAYCDKAENRGHAAGYECLVGYPVSNGE